MSSGGAMEFTGMLPMAKAQFVKAKTCVWWDIENCQVPKSCDPYSIAPKIRKALADLKYEGVVTISAYGDTAQINSSVQQALLSTGITLNHLPAGIKDASDKRILVDMLLWSCDNPPPANHLLISGDGDFSNALHQLSMRKYNILLARPDKASKALVSAAKTVWLWTSLLAGEGGIPLGNKQNLHNTLSNVKSNIETQTNTNLCSPRPDDINQMNNNNVNFDNRSKARQISKTQSQPNIYTSSSNGNEEGNQQSLASSDSSNANHKNDYRQSNHMSVLTVSELGSNSITGSTNPTPCISKSQQSVDPNKPSLSTGPTSAYIQPCSDIGSSNHKNEMTQPSYAHAAQQCGNVDNTSNSFSTKSSSQVLPGIVAQAYHSAAKIWTGLGVWAKPSEKRPGLDNSLSNSESNIETQSCSISCSPQSEEINQKNDDNWNFDNRNDAKQISETQIQPIINTPSCNRSEEGNQQSDRSSDSSNPNQKNDLKQQNHTSFVLTTPDLSSNCISSNMNPTPCIPKSQHSINSSKFDAPCIPISNYRPKIEQKHVNDMNKINNSSNLTQSSLYLVTESSKPYSSFGWPTAFIQPCPNIDCSNHKKEVTQPSLAHEAQESGNMDGNSSSESNTPNTDDNSAKNTSTNDGSNNKVKFSIKNKGIKFHKLHQNKYSPTSFRSRNLSGSYYNYRPSSSPAPTIRPNNYQSAPFSTMPNVSHWKAKQLLFDTGEFNISSFPTQSKHESAIFTGGNLGRQAPYNFLQRQIGTILLALNILKHEKISPTEANISDCICYGDIGIQNFNVRLALDYATVKNIML